GLDFARSSDREHPRRRRTDQEAGGEERHRADVGDGVLDDDERRPEQEGGTDQGPMGERRCSPTAGRSPTAQPVYRLVIGRRRSLPKALGVTRTPGGACRRLYSARSTSVTTRRT